MDELKSWEPSILQKLFSAAGSGMEKASDWLVEKNNPLAFIPYFLSGGHDAAESLSRLGYEGFDRPYRHGQLGQAGHTRVLGDLFIGSQPLTIPGIPMVAKAGLSKIPVKGLQNMSRREFMKKSGALAGGTATSTMLGKALMGLADEAPIAQVAKEITPTLVPKVAKAAAPSYKINSLADYLLDIKRAMLKEVNELESANDFVLSNGELKDIPPLEEIPWNRKHVKEYANMAMDYDQSEYSLAKAMAKDDFKIDPYSGRPLETGDGEDWLVRRSKHVYGSFSPQAKQEIKELKKWALEKGLDWKDLDTINRFNQDKNNIIPMEVYQFLNHGK